MFLFVTAPARSVRRKEALPRALLAMTESFLATFSYDGHRRDGIECERGRASSSSRNTTVREIRHDPVGEETEPADVYRMGKQQEEVADPGVHIAP